MLMNFMFTSVVVISFFLVRIIVSYDIFCVVWLVIRYVCINGDVMKYIFMCILDVIWLWSWIFRN